MSSGVNDNKKADFAFLAERVFHYLLIIFAMLVILFGIRIASIFVQVGNEKEVKSKVKEVYEPQYSSEGKKKNLPDYIVDKVPRDELESLKP